MREKRRTLHGATGLRIFPDGELWFAEPGPLPAGDAGPVRLHHGTHTTPAATIPLVCALAGNGTWLAYVLATIAVLLVALCIARFARYSASPGSLYTYASMILPPWMGATVAWSLLLAYVTTGSSVIGGFYHWANLLLRDATGHAFSTVALAVIVTGVSIWIAWRDVKISARLMLWIEAVSVSVIVVVVVLLLVRHGWHWDWDELHLRGMTGSGCALALYSHSSVLSALRVRQRWAPRRTIR